MPKDTRIFVVIFGVLGASQLALMSYKLRTLAFVIPAIACLVFTAMLWRSKE